MRALSTRSLKIVGGKRNEFSVRRESRIASAGDSENAERVQMPQVALSDGTQNRVQEGLKQPGDSEADVEAVFRVGHPLSGMAWPFDSRIGTALTVFGVPRSYVLPRPRSPLFPAASIRPRAR